MELRRACGSDWHTTSISNVNNLTADRSENKHMRRRTLIRGIIRVALVAALLGGAWYWNAVDREVITMRATIVAADEAQTEINPTDTMLDSGLLPEGAEVTRFVQVENTGRTDVLVTLRAQGDIAAYTVITPNQLMLAPDARERVNVLVQALAPNGATNNAATTNGTLVIMYYPKLW